MKNQIIFSILCFSLFITSCGNSNQPETKEAVKEEQGHEEKAQTIATLTQEQIKTVGITFGNIENKELTATIKTNGMLRVPNNNKGNATSLYGGVIKTLNVQIGDYVSKGQVIATIANPQFIQLQEEYLTIGSKITFAEQEVNRQKELNAGNAGALRNLQNATAELNTLRTRKASLQQQIQLMGINPNSVSNGNLKSALVVTSPLNGTISNLFAKIGSYVDVSSPVAEIVDNSSLHLDLQVFEKDLPKLKIGQVIHFTLTNNPTSEYDAKVFSIGSSFENESKTISVHSTVTGNKKGLIDGMNITGIVSLNNVTTPAVPSEAIVNAEGKDYIFIVTDKKAEEHHDEESEEHDHEATESTHKEEPKDNVNFERIEVVKGVSNMGYTAVTFIQDVPANSKIVTKGAFFINAKLTNTGGHEH
ncbi:efflux transporter periplasmic adaptor subunit [Pelobium manganitolerans]|uniref:Efflux transporter periplasmic adaptor subunit n=1 Tax=Pelobium manganitolerans TaxID=1842495 RepID=A0A419S663_9SPHI|nr:efflux RND transporter periplasmic adaptor subunit [Pelobium manganitolerans]RKD16331.1 efflux transporter periplasmic adaptor subunit [Pelobium manganitolerans]